VADLRRYARQIALPEFGAAGQERLRSGSVLIVGAGGLGSPAALYLAAAGVGRIGLVDFDLVDVTNLQRQVIYGMPDVGRPKLEAASGRLRALNPDVHLDLHAEPFGAANARALVTAYDVVVDGTDNFPTRYLVNDACVMTRTPNVYGSVSRFEGQASVFAAPGGPCYRCLHPEPPADGLILSCAEGGVLGVLPGLIGMVQATEAIKLLTGLGEPLVGRFLLYDALRMRFREIGLARDPDCPVCGDRPTIRDLVEYARTCETGEMSHEPAIDMTIDDLKKWQAEGHSHVLVDVREPGEHAIGAIEGAVLIPLGQLGARVDELPKDQAIVAYCQGGGRSARAVAMLRAKGFDAHNLVGGFRAWQAAED
jgi:molybdopterin/thiamine biosynthesis adenylyltransferase/rhodanese-related sulfurtransferase